MSKQNQFPNPILHASEIERMDEFRFDHPLNINAERYTRSVSDAVGMKNIGVHLVRVEPGKETTAFHFHHAEEEFIYILEGKGLLELGDEEIEVGPGSFIGFTAPSLPHAMRNVGERDLVYLMGGERRDSDVCEYPRLRKRWFRVGDQNQIVDIDE